jgi:CBS-domain-containing membrane protein
MQCNSYMDPAAFGFEAQMVNLQEVGMDPEDIAEALENLQEVLEDALDEIEDALDDLEEGEGFERPRAARLARAAVVGRAVRRRRRRTAVRRVGRARALQALRAR